LGARFRTTGREEKGLAQLVALLAGREAGGSAVGAEDLAAQPYRRRHEPDQGGEGRAGALLASTAAGLPRR
jgi:hypothetical protein